MRVDRRILLDRRGGRGVAALLVGGRLQDLLIEPVGALRAGEIWSARVDKPASRDAGGGVFLDLGGARAFLPGKAPRAQGECVKVEIQRPADAEKAATATVKLNFSGIRIVHTPATPGVNVSRKISDAAERRRLIDALSGLERHGGFVLRTSSMHADAKDLRDEAEKLVAQAAEISAMACQPPRRLRAAQSLEAQASRLWPDAAVEHPEEGAGIDERPLARHGQDEAFAALLGARVELTGQGLSGAWMSCERTAAAVAIDVNAGASRSALAANLAALAEIPRQLRLRGWGGQIVIDLAAIDRGRGAEAEAAKTRYQEALKAAADTPLSVLGFGPLGLLEARRKRDRAPIETLLSGADLDE